MIYNIQIKLFAKIINNLKIFFNKINCTNIIIKKAKITKKAKKAKKAKIAKKAIITKIYRKAKITEKIK